MTSVDYRVYGGADDGCGFGRFVGLYMDRDIVFTCQVKQIGCAECMGVNGSTVPLPLYGKASDIWGRKPILFVALGFFEIGSALCGASQNMNMLIASRVIQGIGGGGIMGLVNIIITDLTSLRYFPLPFSFSRRKIVHVDV